MTLRLLIITILTALTLYAIPSQSQIKAMVESNPELLDTPQAKAMMKEQGLSAQDIKNKLKKTNNATLGSNDMNSTQNYIEFVDNNESNETNSSLVDEEALEEVVKRLNPFEYKTNEELIKSYREKQQIFEARELKRYSDAFYANKNMIDSASVPTPADYIVSPGDVLDLHIYGDRNEKQQLEVSNNGTVELAYIGPLSIGGMTYKEAKKYLQASLKSHFTNSTFNITLSKYSSIQVTLIGDVKYPGVYNLSSFSTPKDLFVVSKGVRESASLREIEIKREDKVVAKLDFYDLLFKGEASSNFLLRHGDIIVVKKAKKLVSIDGNVSNPAIFELTNNETLHDLISYAGGMQASASKTHIKIDRFSKNDLSETFYISLNKAKQFVMSDGDKVYIYGLDSSVDQSVSFYGNVIRPGNYRIGKHKDLTSILKENILKDNKNFFLPETSFTYAVVKHYSENLEYSTNSFELKKVLEGTQLINIYPKDEVYIFNKNDISTREYITTVGEAFVSEGKLSYFNGMKLNDAINASGVDGVLDDKVRVTTINTENGMPHTSFYSLKKDGDVLLSAYDEIEVYDYYKTHILEPIAIQGEVVNPIAIFYEKGISLQTLLDAAGGLNLTAYKDKVEIVRYYIDEDTSRKKRVLYVNLNLDNAADVLLEAYDEVTIYKIPNWSEKRVVELKGEVMFPGRYIISNGEKLSSIIQRAGGYTEEAFIHGGVFTRESIRINQVEQYNQELARIKRELALYNSMPANAKSTASSSALNEVILESKKYEPIGRVSIELERDMDSFTNSEFDLVLKDKDTLTIPNKIDTVTVFGEVFNPSSFVYNSDMSAEEYIEMASGLSRSADDDRIYVIHANGMSEPVDRGWFSAEVDIQKGDTIVVPLYIKEINAMDVTDSIARILSSFALTAAAFTSLGVL